jgi:hypothetical protein
MSSGLLENLLVGAGLLCLGVIVIASIAGVILYTRSKNAGEKPSKTVTLFCGSCGAETPVGNKFCEQCGQALAS